MSGIAGMVGLDSRPVDPEALARLDAALEHRGPDGAGQWIEGAVGLFHRMLHTTPESLRETQPLVEPSRQLALVFDGRIDNREEIRSALETAGAVLRDDTDAELVLRCYECWQEEAPHRLLGDFAFALWDGSRRQLFGARDLLGNRPFFYCVTSPHRLCFASEIQALLRLSEVSDDLDEEMVSEFLLTWSLFPDQRRTFFREIRRLPAAHWLRWNDRGVELQRYWALDPHREIRYSSPGDYVEEFRSLFVRSVAARTRSAKPIGFFLSGGLDSSAVATVAARMNHSRLPLHAYSLHLPLATDETGWAELVARQADIQFHPIHLKVESFLEGLEGHVLRIAEPFIAESWTTDRSLLAAVTSDQVGVILTGHSGDEMFNFPWAYVADLIRHLRVRKLLLELGPYCDYFGSSRGYFLRGALPYLPPRSWLRLWRRAKWRRPPQWINPEFAEGTGLLRRMRETRQDPPFDSRSKQADYRNLTCGRTIGHNERFEMMGAYHGFEVRHPFHDRRLVEFMFAVPWEEKVRQGRYKPFLRDAPGLLPEGLRDLRRKADYRGSWESTMRERDGAALRNLFLSPPLQAAEYVDRNGAQQVCEAFLAGDNSQQRRTWVLACFYVWLQIVTQGGFRSPPQVPSLEGRTRNP